MNGTERVKQLAEALMSWCWAHTETRPVELEQAMVRDLDAVAGWVPLDNCGELKPGQYVALLGSDECVKPLVALARMRDSGDFAWEVPVRAILNPALGPIPEAVL